MSDTPEQPIPIEITQPPPKGNGEEGNIGLDRDYFYIYTNGKWIRVPVTEF